MPITIDGTSGISGNSGAIVSGTSQTASGTTVSFTGIPSWAKRITVQFVNLSTTGAVGNALLIQIGTSGGIESTGYLSSAVVVTGANQTGSTTSTAGFVTTTGLSGPTVIHGTVVVSQVTGNTWVASSSVGSTSAFCYTSGGSKTLSGVLDRITVTTTGTDAFDAGTINIIYE